MLKRIIHRLLRHRHFWRDASFDELSEIYVSMMLRSLALSMVGIFIPVFLIKTGYSLGDIALFFMSLFAARVVMDIVAGYVIARFGPKHALVVSYMLQIGAACLFLTLPSQQWPLFLPAIFWGASNSLFFIAFHTDFSKIKHSEHGGKELGYVTIMERIGATIGPLLGGILATAFGGQYIFLLAMVLLLLGLIPLFRTDEPVKTRQKLDFSGLPITDLKHDLVSHAGLVVESNIYAVMWPVFLTLFVFVENTYAKIGILSSIGFLVSILATYSIGKLVDEKRGNELLRISVISNVFLYGLRPFANGMPFVMGINIANDILNVGYRLPYMKGMYDAADQLPGHRIVYLVTLEVSSSFLKLIIWANLYMLTWLLSSKGVLLTGFAISALGSLAILAQRFPALAYTKTKSHE